MGKFLVSADKIHRHAQGRQVPQFDCVWFFVGPLNIHGSNAAGAVAAATALG